MTLIVTAGQEREVIQSINDVIDSKLPRIIAQDLGTDVTISIIAWLSSSAVVPGDFEVDHASPPSLSSCPCEIRER